MKVAILGAGNLGFGYAAYLCSRGHDVSIWSPSGRGISALAERGGQLSAGGKVSGEFAVRPCFDLEDAVCDADVVIFALPANGHEAVMQVATPCIRDDQIVMITPVASLGASILATFVADAGAQPVICASSTTMLTARRQSATNVNILTIRPVADLSVLPPHPFEQVAGKVALLFETSIKPNPSMLEATLSNIGPIVHVPLALMNLTRIEWAETWFQYEQFTKHVCKLITAIDSERLEIGKAFGYSFHRVEDRMAISFGVKPDTLFEVAAQIVNLRSGGPVGPKAVDTRYLTEDVPFGLEFLSFAGKIAGISTPAIDSCISLARIALGSSLVDNGLLSLLREKVTSKQEFISVAEGKRV